MTKKKSGKREPIYTDFVLNVMDAVCAETKYPQSKHYDIAVAKLRTTNKDGKYTPAQVHSNVLRALKRLSTGTDNVLIRYKKYYLPNQPKYLLEKLSEEYFECLNAKINVPLRPCLISYNMGAFYASAVADEKVRECIANCLQEFCYKILKSEDFYLVIVSCPRAGGNQGFVPNKGSKEFTVLKALEDAFCRIYDKQHISLTKRKSKSGTVT